MNGQVVQRLSIENAIAELTQEVGYWVKNSDPDIDGHVAFEFESEQFALAQRIISGAGLGPSLEDSLSFLVAREGRLHREAEENKESYIGYYALGTNYCSSGWSLYEAGAILPEVQEVLCLWYKTTSGTVLCHFTTGEQDWFAVYLPTPRQHGNHHKELSRVKSGMTSDQYDRWYNSSFLKGKDVEYAEMADFHNTHLVPLGWEPMQTGRQHEMDLQIRHALKFVHGEWANEYGIGERIREILGPDGEMWPCSKEVRPALKGARRLDEATAILCQLEKAAENWRAIVEKWAQEENLPFPVADEDLEDYEDCTEEEVHEDE